MIDRRDVDVPKSIVLVGFMAAGKTTAGRRLAARLGMPFLDTDREIEKATGSSVAEISARYGEKKFRATERELIASLLGRGPWVLSVGGGAFVDEQVRELSNVHATTVWLDPPFELIIDRLARSSERPLASGRSEQELRRLWQQRRQSYAKAHLRIEISETDPDKLVDQILDALS